MNNLLFVYGSLLPNSAPSHLAEITARLKPVSAGSMSGRLYDLGQFPGAVYDAHAATRVFGQVVELPNDSQLLARLDEYEGYSPATPATCLFVREKLPI